MINRQCVSNIKNKKTCNFNEKVYLKKREKNIVKARISCQISQ